MNDTIKKRQLKTHKALATGLFVLMCILFLLMTYFEKYHHFGKWIGYVKAFSEAAMVGALADWFAVTALFHHPFGLKIPHTNLIEKSKEKIGDNLGNFVVTNFLSPQNIRPYIQQLRVSHFMGEWLQKEKNVRLILHNFSEILMDILHRLEDEVVIRFIENKALEIVGNIKVNIMLGNGIEYLLEKQDHQKIITHLSAQIKKYVLEHQDMIRERVKKESFALIPSFVDDKIAGKITIGLSRFFDEIEQDENHLIRTEITQKILGFAQELKESPKYSEELNALKNEFLSPAKINEYAHDVWASLKKTISQELIKEDSSLKKYVKKNLAELSEKLISDEGFQFKIDHWIRVTAYKYILRNTNKFGELISTTIGNWQGKELSEKLELEVGKDLQFIRINGTLVGGLVGLAIYAISKLI